MSDGGTSATPKMPGKQRRAQILSVATDLFARMGYEGTSLRDVAEHCGMTKAALYYHFTDKETLLRSVVEYRMSRLNDTIAEALQDIAEDQPLERIRAFVRASGRHMDRDRAGWVVGSRIFWSIDAIADRDAVIALRDDYEGRLKAEIVKAIDTGQLIDADPGMMTRMILSWLNYTPRWHKPEGKMTVEEVADQFLDLTLSGFTPR
ncbi:TetR/AcrR family transcriptional regulator [Pseudooceanicola sp. MF1-13]|uniref:TetR/AcrR family transcriptional regulator n=1 Tax=Pseudooceanicola sp. MF1-13 TaxID=3379095 RepID=UPI0038916D86